MYDIKWKNDLKMYLQTFTSFVFEGNINDLQPVKGEGEEYRYLPLHEAIAELYGEEYSVVFYDHTKLSGLAIPKENSRENENDPQPAPVLDEKWFNSFVFAERSLTVLDSSTGERIPSPNIALFLEYYRDEYLRKKDESTNKGFQADITKDMQRIYDAMADFEKKSAQPEYKDAKPYLFILPDVSRYMTRPGEPTEKENAILLVLFKAIQLVGTRCKLMLFVDKMNDLPTWFESENNNSAIKKIFLPSPDGKFRETFYRLEMSSVMEPVDEKNLDKLIKKFSAYTENFSLRRLQQLRTFIVEESPHQESGAPSYRNLQNIDKTIFRFEVGQSYDPWRDPSLRTTIRELSASLNEIVKGQRVPVARVSEVMKSAATGVTSSKKNDRRPRAIFFFAGPTGVGKTELSKQLAEKIFLNQDSIIRFDMSEFQQDHTESRLFGAPPGYVGYEAGGELTKAIKQKPFSVVLFDEIEKASPRIWDKFLQILGDGRLTDGKGETVSFTQSIIIFTSNLGITSLYRDDKNKQKALEEVDASISATLTALKTCSDEDKTELVKKLVEQERSRAAITGLTVDLAGRDLFTKYSDEYGMLNDTMYVMPTDAFNAFVENCVRDRIENYFEQIGRREVLGRIDKSNILVFNFISPNVADEIAMKAIRDYCENLRTENESRLNLSVTDAALEFIKEHTKTAETLNFGGRGVVTCVEKLVGSKVGEFIFEHSEIGLSATLDCVDGALEVRLG